ncbi:MAG: hypothetical protein ACK40G_12800 [Cytophagaceae bacterium]
MSNDQGKEQLYLRFREIFWDAFHRPNLKSEKFSQLYLKDLDPITEWLAGPMYSIFKEGHCNYIFENPDKYKIYNQEDFLDWCMEKISQFRHINESIAPENESEQRDQQILLYQNDVMMELAEIAYEVSRQ